MGRVGLGDEVRDDGCGRGSRAAGERFGLDAPLVGAYGDMPLVRDADEIDVRALREPPGVVADRAAAAADIDRAELLGKFDVMGDARIEEPPSCTAADLPDIAHTQLHKAFQPFRAADCRRMQAVGCTEILVFAADSQMFGEEGEAAGSVAAHLAFRTVGVEVAHRAVLLGAARKGHQTVGPDAEVAVAELGDPLRIGCEASFAVVDQDEVVAGSFVFGKQCQHFGGMVM